MAKTYDTVDFRRIAFQIQESSEDVSKTSGGTVRWIRDDIPDHLSGETADALAETADEIQKELSSCSKELNEIGLQLKRYAIAMEQADRKTAELIQSR